jgi:hypothetical protein
MITAELSLTKRSPENNKKNQSVGKTKENKPCQYTMNFLLLYILEAQ